MLMETGALSFETFNCSGYSRGKFLTNLWQRGGIYIKHLWTQTVCPNIYQRKQNLFISSSASV